ncbi:polysaccharide deacetylase family protein [Phreatobacter sp.]|uniref:polysaccharide deacetylase family protein n=1 Tax=Phreatobacter sp. TaxID=1966341 RepID=UPI003F6F20EE
MLRIIVSAVVALLVPLLLTGLSRADPTAVKRDIVVVYDSANDATPTDTQVHLRAEFPLNHLGYRLVYRDLSQGLPDEATLSSAVAVLSWFHADVQGFGAYLSWLDRVSASGVKVIILGSVGGPLTSGAAQVANRIFGRMGIRLTGDVVTIVSDARIAALDPELMEFERKVDPVVNPHVLVERSGPGARVGLEYELRFEGRERRSVVAATGPGGGYVAHGFIVHGDAVTGDTRWILNPFAFFEAVLGRPSFPVPDTTTVSGRRLYFSHVDGDGWNNGVHLEAYRPRRAINPGAPGAPRTVSPPQSGGDGSSGAMANGRAAAEQVTASQLMLQELIEPYPDLPMSVGLVAEDIDEELGGGLRAIATARRIFALPQVEVASHTCTHPFLWEFFENYNRDQEYQLITQQDRGNRDLASRLMEAIGVANASDRRRRRYLAGGNHAPRAFLRDPFSIGREVTHALRVTQDLAPPGKSIALYLWSGNTRPFERIVRATRQAGVRNINGGDTRFDTQYPSIAYVSPISRSVGGERQIYAVNSNENTYTNLWTSHFHGFRQLRETLERTELPRRLKGVNVYYHTYSAERRASLEAVRYHLDWARSARLAPIKASHYAAIADGFFSAKILQTGPQSWSIGDRDGLQTLRFDQAADLVPDIARSTGVLGSNSHAGSLYIALDAGVDTASLVLTSRSSLGLPTFAAASLRESRWQLSQLRREACALRFTAEGYGKGEFVFDRLPAGAVNVVASRKGEVLHSERVQVEPDGTLTFSIAATGFEPLDVEIRCGGRE